MSAGVDWTLCANTLEDMFKGKPARLAMGQLDAVAGQDRVALVRQGGDQMRQALGGNPLSGRLMQLDTGGLAVQSMATNSLILPSLMRTSAMSIWKYPIRQGLHFFFGLSPATSGRRLIPWRRGNDRVRCGGAGCSA